MMIAKCMFLLIVCGNPIPGAKTMACSIFCTNFDFRHTKQLPRERASVGLVSNFPIRMRAGVNRRAAEESLNLFNALVAPKHPAEPLSTKSGAGLSCANQPVEPLPRFLPRANFIEWPERIVCATSTAALGLGGTHAIESATLTWRTGLFLIQMR